jgi:DNA-binding transcriptional MerR regulator
LELKINEVAKLTGVTVRTLHYYDEIGLLRPSEITDTGYRLYDEQALERLQQILFFRELDFPLSEIKAIMQNPNFDKTEALSKHRALLIKKRDRLDGLIDLVNNTIKGEKTMSFQEFDSTEIEKYKKQYAAEVKQRWGHTDAYAESKAKTESYGKQQWQQIDAEGAAILKAFSDNRDKAADSTEIQALVKQWQDFISSRFYKCTNEILCCLGELYVGDQRFKDNIDKNGEGTAEFIKRAIDVFCSK